MTKSGDNFKQFTPSFHPFLHILLNMYERESSSSLWTAIKSGVAVDKSIYRRIEQENAFSSSKLNIYWKKPACAVGKENELRVLLLVGPLHGDVSFFAQLLPAFISQ